MAESSEETPETPEVPTTPKWRSKKVWLGGAIAAALVLGGLAWWIGSTQTVKTVTVLGVDYTTNLEMDVYDGNVYVSVPVNTNTGEAVLKVDNKEDNEQIREFLDSLDTLVPGEHALALSETNLRFIVDGMAE